MKKVLILFVGLLCAAPAFAAGEGNLKLSLWGDIAWAVPANKDLISGLDLGIGSHTDEVKGVQLDLIMAQTRYELRGLSWAWLINLTEHAIGVQGAALTRNSQIIGAQFGLVNLSDSQVSGAQLGFYNQAERIKGLQFGFVNYARQIQGLQIGILNIAENGWFPAMVLVNGRF